MIEVVVESIRVSLVNQQRLVVLREQDSPRFLPIWIGTFEADAITMGLRRDEVPRPMTHDLLAKLIDELGAQVKYVWVNDLREDTFFAQIVLEHAGRQIEVDARSSDAIALAVRAGVSIFVSEHVMNQAGQLPAEDFEGENGEAEPGPAADNLEVFREFIDSLDLSDLGEGES